MAYKYFFLSSYILTIYFVALQPYYSMEFKNIHKGTQCKCVDGDCKINTKDFFYRKLKSGTPSIEDFRSYDELDKKPTSKTPTCYQVCSYKSLSLSKHVDGKNVLDIYLTTKKIKPNATIEFPFYCKLRFSDKCGKIKPSPSHNDPNHQSFFKSDEFDIKNVTIIAINKIA
jgi:hypothetical protein